MLPKAETVEVHLALGFNNLIFDHPSLPQALRDQIREYTFANHANERGPGETDAQFFYNTRKKSWKVMKKPFWEMPAQAQADIMASLQDMFRNMFTWMNVGATSKLVTDNTTLVKVAPAVPEALRKARAA
jgi:hypothetical protein